MSGGGGGGGGVSLFGAWAIVRLLFSGRKSMDEAARRAALDAEELREVEYQDMGMVLPPRMTGGSVTPPPGRLDRWLGRRR